jgi:hypothetical protein
VPSAERRPAPHKRSPDVKATITRTLASGLVAAAVLVGAGGCFLLPAATPTPTSAASETPSAVPEPTPTPTPESQTISCESVLNPDTIASWEGDGVTQNLNFVQKLNDEDLALKAFNDFGGIICQWGFANTGATAIYGYSKISRDDMITWQNHLGDDMGADVSVYAGNNLYTVNPAEFAESTEYYLFNDGPTDYFWMYAWSTDQIDEMLANISNP